MSPSTTSTPNSSVPAHVAQFNQKIGELLKSADPSQVVDILTHPSSLLSRAASDNQNQNQGGRRLAQ